jgi:hypothetical protein
MLYNYNSDSTNTNSSATILLLISNSTYSTSSSSVVIAGTAVPVSAFTLVGVNHPIVGFHVPTLDTIVAGSHKNFLVSILLSIPFVASTTTTTTSIILAWAVSGLAALILAYNITSAYKGPKTSSLYLLSAMPPSLAPHSVHYLF